MGKMSAEQQKRHGQRPEGSRLFTSGNQRNMQPGHGKNRQRDTGHDQQGKTESEFSVRQKNRRSQQTGHWESCRQTGPHQHSRQARDLREPTNQCAKRRKSFFEGNLQTCRYTEDREKRTVLPKNDAVQDDQNPFKHPKPRRIGNGPQVQNLADSRHPEHTPDDSPLKQDACRFPKTVTTDIRNQCFFNMDNISPMFEPPFYFETSDRGVAKNPYPASLPGFRIRCHPDPSLFPDVLLCKSIGACGETNRENTSATICDCFRVHPFFCSVRPSISNTLAGAASVSRSLMGAATMK